MKIFQKLKNFRAPKIPSYSARVAIGYGSFFMIAQITISVCLILTQQLKKVQHEHEAARFETRETRRIHEQEKISDTQKIFKLKKVFGVTD